MQTQTQSKKRPAPGTVPGARSQLQQQQQQGQAYHADLSGLGEASEMSDDQFMAWGAGNQNTGDAGHVFNTADAYTADNYSPDDTTQQLFTNPAQAPGQLIRRETNNQLARQLNHFAPLDQDIWNDIPNGVPNPFDVVEDDEELERKAAAAKKEAQSKRPPKQIPPFIQKLSSFLDASNTDLIRWSDDGNSFVVLDEDEFAKKLIPELFKHNNYASFVRQLNMYGFHKKVGLSDNSMRASEKKAKSPSEYYNPYFKRGRPELLWLIQKPKSEGKGPKRPSRKQGSVEHDSGDERASKEKLADTSVEVAVGHDRPAGDVVQFQDQERHIASLQRDVANLQRAQQQIYSGLARLRDENNQYIRQASTLVAQHERHENSINAILTFLATFYNRSLGGEGNVGNMFAGAIPNNQPQGNVVDVGDEEELQPTMQNQLQRQRRPLALMPAPTSPSNTAGRTSPFTKAQQQPINRLSIPPEFNQQPPSRSRIHSSNPSSARSTPMPTIKDSPRSPRLTDPFLDATAASAAGAAPPSNDQIMNLINNVNASSAHTADTPGASAHGPRFDFPSALRHYENANGNAPLTPEQRNNMLSLMANTSGTSTPLPTNLANPTNTNDTDDLLAHFANQNDQLDLLARLQQEQDSKVQSLADRLQPLSPSGSIPGLAAASPYPGGPNPGLHPSESFDLNTYVNDDYFPGLDVDVDADADAALDFDGWAGAGADGGIDGFGEQGGGTRDLFGDSPGEGGEVGSGPGSIQGGGRVVGSVASSSEAPSPAVEDVVDEELAGGQRPGKRRKTGR